MPARNDAAPDAREDYRHLHHGTSEEAPLALTHDVWHDRERERRDVHYELELGIVMRGAMRRAQGGWRANFPAGSIWLGGIWEPHAGTATRTPLELIMFHIHPSLLIELALPETPGVYWLSPFTLPPARRPHPQTRSGARWLAIAEELRPLVGARSPADRLRMRLLFYRALFLLFEIAPDAFASGPRPPDASTPDAINRAIELALRARRFVSVAEGAAEAGLNRNRFARVFRERMGIGFADFCLRHRLQSAARQIRQTDRPLKAIAAEWGFSDKSHFHRRFTRLYGVTPAAYRRPP